MRQAANASVVGPASAADGLLSWAAERGYLVAWGPARMLLEQARRDLEQRVKNRELGPGAASGQIDAAFAAEYLSFDYDCGGLDDGALLIVVMPRPAHLVAFTRNGARVNAVMPPTYERYRPTFEDVRRDLAQHGLAGHRLVTVTAPLKLLAARLGLVRYGRNNLTYAPGFGSYLQLLGYATDADLPVAPGWTPPEPQLLDECETCAICAASCPTGAIVEDHFLLNVERCLTLANEAPGPWPTHVPDGAHHCLIGCLLCQRDCPGNPALPIQDTGVAFTEEETRELVADGSATAQPREHAGPAWEGIRDKLQALGQPYQEPVIGRNLRAFLLGGHI